MSEQREPNAKAAGRARRLSLGRLIDDFIVLASGQFISKIFGFIAFAWLARQLSVEEYGAVETAFGMAAIGAIALEMGTGAVGVRRISQKHGSAPEVLGSVITARACLAVVVAPFLAVFYAGTTKTVAPDILFWLFAASLFAIPLNHNWFFQSQERMGVAGFGQTLRMGVFLIAVFALAPQERGVIFVAIAEILGAAAMAVWFSAFAYSMIRPARPHYRLGAGVALIRESAEVGASAFVNALAQYLPILILAAASSGSETAQFGAAQRLLLSLITFSFIYYFNLYPLIARRIVEDHDSLRVVLSASVRVTAWAGVTTAGMLHAAAPLVMGLVFGGEFRAAGPEFGALVWSGAIVLSSGNARWLLIAGRRQSSLLVAQLANAAVVVGLGLVLAPSFGAMGAAAACIAGALSLWTIAHIRTQGLPVRPRLRDSAPAYLSALAIIGALTLTDFAVWQNAGLAAAILAVGAAADRGLLPAFRALVRAKSAT